MPSYPVQPPPELTGGETAVIWVLLGVFALVFFVFWSFALATGCGAGHAIDALVDYVTGNDRDPYREDRRDGWRDPRPRE